MKNTMKKLLALLLALVPGPGGLRPEGGKQN